MNGSENYIYYKKYLKYKYKYIETRKLYGGIKSDNIINTVGDFFKNVKSVTKTKTFCIIYNSNNELSQANIKWGKPIKEYEINTEATSDIFEIAGESAYMFKPEDIQFDSKTRHGSAGFSRKIRLHKNKITNFSIKLGLLIIERSSTIANFILTQSNKILSQREKHKIENVEKMKKILQNKLKEKDIELLTDKANSNLTILKSFLLTDKISTMQKLELILNNIITTCNKDNVMYDSVMVVKNGKIILNKKIIEVTPKEINTSKITAETVTMIGSLTGSERSIVDAVKSTADSQEHHQPGLQSGGFEVFAMFGIVSGSIVGFVILLCIVALVTPLDD
jgi:hypothetical protein